MDKDSILKDVITTIKNLTPGWEIEFYKPIGPETFLGSDLALKSIDLARLVTAIRKLYNHQEIPYQELLMPDNRPVYDLRIADIVDFLHKHLNHQ